MSQPAIQFSDDAGDTVAWLLGDKLNGYGAELTLDDAKEPSVMLQGCDPETGELTYQRYDPDSGFPYGPTLTTDLAKVKIVYIP